MTILPLDTLFQPTTHTALENDAIRMPFTRHAELVSASMSSAGAILAAMLSVWTLKQVQGDENVEAAA